MLLSTTAWAQTVWGSFDTTRINYSSGTLNGGAHTTLRGIIVANSGSVAADTATLTAGYLSGVDVFYTAQESPLLPLPNAQRASR